MNKVAKKKKIKKVLSDIAKFLEDAGFIDASSKIQCAIDMLDDGDFLDDAITTRTPDVQHAVPGSMPVTMTGEVGGGMQSIFNVPEAEKIAALADELDQKGLHDEADELDSILKDIIDGDEEDGEDDELLEIIKDLEETRDKKTKCKVEKDEDDKEGIGTLVDANGHRGITSIHDQNSGMFQGFSDAYFYSNYGNLEGPYGPQ